MYKEKYATFSVLVISIRVMAIDHGQFSFIDVKHGVWPIVLITHPKTVVLVSPGGKSSIPFSKYIRYYILESSNVLSFLL